MPIQKIFGNGYRTGALLALIVFTALAAARPESGGTPPLELFLVAVLAAAWQSGWRAGWATSALSATLGAWLLSAHLADSNNPLRLASLLAMGGLISTVVSCRAGGRQASAARDQAEAALREQEHFAAKVLSSSLNGLYIFDSSADALSLINAQFTALTGYRLDDFKQAQAPGFFGLFLHPDDQARHQAHLEALRHAQDDEALEIEYRFRRADGEWRWFLCRHTVFSRGPGGALREVLGSLLDISDRKRGELAVAYERALLDALQMNAPVGLGYMGLDFRFAHVNETLAAINGLPAAEHTGRKVAEVIPELWPQVEPAYRRVLERDEPLLNVAFDGTTPAMQGVHRHWLANFYPVRVDQDIVGIGVVVVEITEQKRAEAEIRTLNAHLAQRLAQLQALFDLVPVGLILTEDPACRIMRMNATLAKMTGLPQEINASLSASCGERPPWKLLRGGEVVPPDQLPIQKAVATGQEVEDDDLEWVLDNGKSFKLITRVAPLLDASGKVQGAVGVLVDITERLELEERLKSQAAQLQGVNRRKDEFLATLAHELRNPLAPIRNAAYLLRRAVADNPTAHWAETVISRQVEHLAHLVDDLLDISRLTRGKITLDMQPVAIADLLDHAAEASLPVIESHNQKLSIAPPPAAWVAGDRVRLIQVLGNLLDNAAKYSPEGAHIWLSAEAGPDEVVVRVKDEGVGIAPDLLPVVFDLFAQGDRSLDRAQGGLGIGLSLVRSLAEMHGGRAEAHSPGLGLGSEFVIRLPRRLPPEPQAAPPPAPNAAGRRVLVIDDNEDSTDSLGVLLELQGHEVAAAYDAHAGLSAARSFRPDVVLLDIGLPGMDGYEAARRLREEFGKECPLLIAMTGYGQAEDIERSKEAGFDHHLVKPVDEETLARLLEQCR
jgi:PAS domain S-box-containing protein